MEDSLGTGPEKPMTPVICPAVLGSTVTNEAGFAEESEAGCDRWLQPAMASRHKRKEEEMIFMACRNHIARKASGAARKNRSLALLRCYCHGFQVGDDCVSKLHGPGRAANITRGVLLFFVSL